MAHKPTEEQQAVIDAFADGKNLTVKAAAGAGKTTTLVSAAETRPSDSGLYTAFNSKIIRDSARKFGPNVKCSTLHALAKRIVLPAHGGWRQERFNSRKRQRGAEVARLLNLHGRFPINDERTLSPAQMANLVMETVDRFCDSGDTRISRRHVPRRRLMDDPASMATLSEVLLPYAVKAWEDLTSPRGSLSYDHSHYLKEWVLSEPQIPADFILLDEAQDSNGVTVALLKAQRFAQIITVGDENQSIYGWRGAVDAMNAFDGDVLTLTQSFRFGPAIANEANKWLETLGSDLRVRGFDPIPSAITDLGREGAPTPDAILTRTNAEAITQVMKHQAEGFRVAVLGGGEAMEKLALAAQDLREKGWTAHPELRDFNSWSQLQHYANHDHGGGDLKTFVKLIDEHGTNKVIASTRKLWHENDAQVCVSTVHKCKGAEWDRVRIASDFTGPTPDEDGQLIVSRDDAMLAYVAVTRAKLELDPGSLAYVNEVLAKLRARQAPAVAEVETITVQAPTGTVIPLDLTTHFQRPPVARQILEHAARVPFDAAAAVEVPQWRKDGLPGSDWTGEEWQALKARNAAEFDRSLQEAAAEAQPETELFESPVDPTIAETVPAPAPTETVTCGAKHKAWLNTACRRAPHGPEVLHQDIGLEWDDSKCSELGIAPAHV